MIEQIEGYTKFIQKYKEEFESCKTIQDWKRVHEQMSIEKECQWGLPIYSEVQLEYKYYEAFRRTLQQLSFDVWCRVMSLPNKKVYKYDQ